MNSKAQWRDLNDYLGVILETSLQGCVENRIETLTTLYYNIGKERFGVEERKEKNNIKQTPNRREQNIKQLRKEPKDPKQTEEVEKYLHETHSDKERETPLGYCPRVEEEEQPTIEFETKEPTWKEVREVRWQWITTHSRSHQEDSPEVFWWNTAARFTVDNKTTAWQKLERNSYRVKIISPILFIMSMNIIMKAAERETTGPKTESGIFLPATRGFMDDLTVTTSSHIQARWILLALEEVVTWARMKFKPRNSRSMILRKGQITTKFQLKIQGDEILTIVDNPIKCLGKWFDDTFKDNTNVKTVQTQVSEWLKKVDKSGLFGKFKAWIYQHGLLQD
ncbi:unnamed protein product [Mytilus coruscus]|uniref:Reverse transcriptase domain-containing protein n=1 Tax=Mytilus coruscus TaxID=42192 RepID=A0A6J8DGQ2_MYTCO|nr:unnamed protein product [Mytilus coruscus]